MEFKEFDTKAPFLDIDLQGSYGQCRTRQFLPDANHAVNRKPIDFLVTASYSAGQSQYGIKAYPSLMLSKALLQQKWFEIKPVPNTCT